MEVEDIETLVVLGAQIPLHALVVFIAQDGSLYLGHHPLRSS